MLFNSHLFLLFFLPATLLGASLLKRWGNSSFLSFWLIGVSLVFYQFSDSGYIFLLLLSVIVNYQIAGFLLRTPLTALLQRRTAFTLCLIFNLGLLGYFKYAQFGTDILQALTGVHWIIRTHLLPLGISFFTFSQLMYLVDVYAGLVEKPYRFLSYLEFVVFFPYLIAGPIARHDEIIPQFAQNNSAVPAEKRAMGWSFLAIGLFKKVIIADHLGLLAKPVFERAAEGGVLTLGPAWAGALSYTLQLYFDFSGYSDMAVGLGYLLGITLPFNFNSPFKARNVIDFWQRWHITLTRFLTNYIYNPLLLSISRWRIQKGWAPFSAQNPTAIAFFSVVAFPTLLTMLVAGVWHGAGWPFVAFGLVHGFYLIVNHAWRTLRTKHSNPSYSAFWGQGLTFVCVVCSLVFFRSKDLTSAWTLFQAMAGKNGWRGEFLTPPFVTCSSLAALLGVVWVLPNTQEWLSGSKGLYQKGFPWTPQWTRAVWIGALAALAILFIQASPEFLYFEF